MGRPALGVKPTMVRLAPQVLERIDSLLGPHRRAEFIRFAVERELQFHRHDLEATILAVIASSLERHPNGDVTVPASVVDKILDTIQSMPPEA